MMPIVGTLVWDGRLWFTELEHLGLTTWSGNVRMMSCAHGLGWQQEACIRRVRYWQGTYYDSVKYGVLREEWGK